MKLHSKRLSKVAWMIEEHKQGTILADIGTDHAYLLCFLLDENIITSAYACDVAEGPLSSSKETIQSLHLEDQVIPLLGNGLDPIIDKKVDMISVCGMGGLLMSEILDAHLDYVEDKILFLQANTAIDLLREYLMNHNLQIIDEALVKDAHHIYEIMVAKKGHQELDEKDILFGPVLRKQKDPLFIEKWERELKIQRRILDSLNIEHEKYAKVLHSIALIEEVL